MKRGMAPARWEGPCGVIGIICCVFLLPFFHPHHFIVFFFFFQWCGKKQPGQTERWHSRTNENQLTTSSFKTKRFRREETAMEDRDRSGKE